MASVELVATLTNPLSPTGSKLSELASSVSWTEIRADLIGEPDVNQLCHWFPGQLLYTLRSQENGGAYEGSLFQRHQRLLEAARTYDLIDLEFPLDCTLELLDRIPPQQRLISWHGVPANLDALQEQAKQMFLVNARYYKVVTLPTCEGEAFLPLQLLHLKSRKDLIAYADGALGWWTQLLAPHLGSPCVFGNLEDSAVSQDAPTLTQLCEDYHFPLLQPVREIFGIVGNPVHQSLSPRLHNAAYWELGKSALYLPFHAESFFRFWSQVVNASIWQELGWYLRGLTVVSPFKEDALPMTTVQSPIVQSIGATNVMVRQKSTWYADTTDPQSALIALYRRGLRVDSQKVAVVGCGGAGRAIASALQQAGAKVTLVNRSDNRGQWAEAHLGLPYLPLSQFSPEGFWGVVNATPLGRDGESLPFDPTQLSQKSIVIDLVYGSQPTPLVQHARSRGCITVDGIEIFEIQVVDQFRLMTGEEMPHSYLAQKSTSPQVRNPLLTFNQEPTYGIRT